MLYKITCTKSKNGVYFLSENIKRWATMSKKSITKCFKKKIVAGVIAFGMALASFTGLAIAHKDAFAYSAEDGLIKNYNFKNTSSSATPPSPSEWSKISSSFSDDIVSGVFSAYKGKTTEDEKYLDKFMLHSNPGTPKEEDLPASESADTKGVYNSLLINSPKTQGRAGYESNSFTLNADSYYEVHVTVMTRDDKKPENSTAYSDWDSRASIYLMDKNDSKDVKVVDSFELVDTNNEYLEYIMYIATDEFESTTSSLQLYLGGKESTQITTGAVLFHSAQVVQMDRSTYLHVTEKGEDSHTTITNLREDNSFEPISNASFEEDYKDYWNVYTSDSTISKVERVNGNAFSDSQTALNTGLSGLNPLTNKSSSSNINILFMNLSDKGEVSVSTKSPITIKQHGFYRLSVWAYAVGSNGSASIVLHDNNERVEDVSLSVGTSTSSSTSYTNNWVKYSFYIYGNAYSDSEVVLTLKLSTETSGYVFFDDIYMQQISGTSYNDNKSNTNSTSFSLTPDNSLYKVSNYEFDSTANETSNITYPLAPKDWKASMDSDNSIGGIINTATQHFNANKSGYAIKGGSIPSNPGFVDGINDDSNNVLMIGSSSDTNKASFTTENSISLSASTTYKLSLYAYGTSNGVGIKVYNDKYYLFDKNNISLSGWGLVEVYITTGVNTEDVYIELSQNNKGYAFFDKVKVEDSSTDAYTESVCAYKYRVDLTTLDWSNTLLNGSNFADLNMFEINQNASGVLAGIKDISESYYGVTAPSGSNGYALVIDSNTPCYFNIVSKKSYSLSSGSYYTIEALVRTIDIQQNGAYFGISGDGIDYSFDVDTKIDDILNQWTVYTFYINAQKDTEVNIVLGLGNSENQSSGILLVDYVKFAKLTDVADEEAFNQLVSSNLNQNTVKAVTIEADSESETDNSETDNKEKNSGEFNWAIIPSLITALALFIALIGTLVRKVNWKGHTKVKTTYDRRKTLEKDMDRRERIALRQQIIAELNDQILAIDNEIAEYKLAIEEQEKIEQTKIAEQQREFIEKKQAITAEKEQLLRERNEKLAVDKNAYTAKAEAEFNAYIKKLELKEQKQQHIINSKENALKDLHARRDARLAQYLARQEKIREEIARVDAEIEEIAREEAQIWEEYKQAKADAKRRKAEYKAQIKQEKEARKSTRKSSKSVSETKTSDDIQEDATQNDVDTTSDDSSQTE